MASPSKKVLDALQRKGCEATAQASGNWKALCPAHDNTKTPALLVNEDSDGRIWFKCFTGCSHTDVRKSLGLAKHDLLPGGKKQLKDWNLEKSNKDPKWIARQRKYRKQARDPKDRLFDLKFELDLPLSALNDVGAGWCEVDQCYTFPECDADGDPIAILRRFPKKTAESNSGSDKKIMKGGSRGVYLPKGWKDRAIQQELLLLPEGASDTVAVWAAGLAAIGRPSNVSGEQIIADLVEELPTEVKIVVVGEWDVKDDGSWPGKDGAQSTAAKLADLLERPVCWSLTPKQEKDSRTFLQNYVRKKFDRKFHAKKQHRMKAGRALSKGLLADRQIKTINPIRDDKCVSNSEDEEPMRATKIIEQIYEYSARTPGLEGSFPFRVGSDIFSKNKHTGELIQFKKPPDLYAWCDLNIAPVRWTKAEGMLDKETFFGALQQNADRYDSIATAPHYPKRPGVFYLLENSAMPSKNNRRLWQLLEMFEPATDIDRYLLTAFVLTLVWGGPPGHRPAFLFQGPEVDTHSGGRGTGKTTAMMKLAKLVGGHISIDRSSTIEKIKSRLVSAEACMRRVVLMDNVKTDKLSWGELESLITDAMCSGWQLYRGQTDRPNLFVYGITVNEAGLSTDMAQRSIPVRFARPEYDKDWNQDIEKIFNEYRWQILGDCVDILSKPPRKEISRRHLRWSIWENATLTRTGGDPDEILDALEERQQVADADRFVKDEFRAFVKRKLRKNGLDPETDNIFIRTRYIKSLYTSYFDVRIDLMKAITQIRKMNIPELPLGRSWGRSHGDRKGVIWFGLKAFANSKVKELDVGIIGDDD